MLAGNQFVMRFKLRIWSWIFVIASCATAQDININNNNPNLQYDINNPYSTITPNSYDVNNGPYTQDPTYGDRYGNDQFGRDNVNNRPDQYDPNSGQYNPYPGQFDPQTGLYDQYGKPDQFGGRGGTPNTPWKQNPFGFGTGRNEIDASGSIIREGLVD
jgi:hypothetical protein